MSLRDDYEALNRSAAVLTARDPVGDAIEAATKAIAEALLPKDLKPAQRKRMLGLGGSTLRSSIAHLLDVKIGRDLHLIARDMEALPEQLEMLED